MNKLITRRLLVFLVAFSALFSGSVSADWHRFESEHFILHADERITEGIGFVENLELELNVLKRVFGLNLDENSNKLEVFALTSRAYNRHLTGDAPIFQQHIGQDIGVFERSRSPTRLNSKRFSHYNPHVANYYISNTDIADFPYWYLEGIKTAISISSVDEDVINFKSVGKQNFGLPSREVLPLDELFDNLQNYENLDQQRNYWYTAHWILQLVFFSDVPELRERMQNYLFSFLAGEREVNSLVDSFGIPPDEFPYYLDELIADLPRFAQIPNEYVYSGGVKVSDGSESEAFRVLAVVNSIASGDMPEIVNVNSEEGSNRGANSQLTTDETTETSVNALRMNGEALLADFVNNLQRGDLFNAEPTLDKLHYVYHMSTFLDPKAIHNLIEEVRIGRKLDIGPLDISLPDDGLRWNNVDDIAWLKTGIAAVNTERSKELEIANAPTQIEEAPLTLPTIIDESFPSDDLNLVKDLVSLAELFERGLLTEREFENAKTRLLERGVR